MRTGARRLKHLILVVVAATLLAVASAQTLTIAHNQDPVTLNPLLTTAAANEAIIQATMEKLAVFEPGTMRTIPWLLEGWEFRSETELVLTLKPGISFSNGEPLNAEAVRFSIDAWRQQPVMAQASAGLKDAELEVVDDLHLIVRTKAPVPTLITRLGRYGYVVPPAYYAEVGPEGFGQAPIGTGPYLFDTHEAGSRVLFSRNDAYWRGTPGYEHVVFRIMPDDFARGAALEAGEVDIAYLLSDTAADRLQSVDGVEVHSLLGLRKFLAAYNAEMPGGEPLLDPNVRLALNYAVDVQAIVDSVFGGKAATLGGEFALPAEFGYSEVEPFGYDPERARQMLAAAGYPNGFPVTLAYTVGTYPKDKEVGEILASYLESVGLTVTQRALEWGQFNTERKERTLGHIIAFGLLFSPDLDFTFNYMAFGKEARGAPLLTWSDEWWTAYNESARTVDPDRRAELYAQLLQIDRESPYGIYLFAPYDYYGTRTTVEGFVPREDQFLFLYDVKPKD